MERTFGEAYRKEVDQEENVWRSLPFFAATLALQLTALAPIRDWLTGLRGWRLGAVEGLLVAAGLATLCALAGLLMSVWPARFERLAPELDTLAFAEGVRDGERRQGAAGGAELDRRVLAATKRALLQQYALAAGFNRAINRRRTAWRALAAMATLASVTAVLVLVALAVLSNIHADG